MHTMPDGGLTDNPDRPHDFETEGRQDERTVTPCAVCGLSRNDRLHD